MNKFLGAKGEGGGVLSLQKKLRERYRDFTVHAVSIVTSDLHKSGVEIPNSC